MKKIQTPIILAASLLMISCGTTIESTRVSVERGYHKVFSQNLEGPGTLTELIPVNETNKNWTKMFSIQLMKGAPFAPKKHMNIFVERATKNCGDKFKTNVIAENENSVTFEWSVENCTQIDNMKHITPYVNVEDCNMNYFTGLIWHGSKFNKQPSKCNKKVTQHEIARFIKGNDGLHRVALTQKSEKISGNTRKQWLASLKKAYVVKGGARVTIK